MRFQKLQTEIAKIEADRKRIQAETAEAPLQQQKLQAEIDKLKEDTRKTQRETAGIGAISPYSEERSFRTVQSVDELLKKYLMILLLPEIKLL